MNPTTSGEHEWTRESVLAIARRHIGQDAISDAVADAHNAALAAEREKALNDFKQYHHNPIVAGLNKQLAAAQAAIAELREWQAMYCGYGDTACLDSYVAEKCKPLVDALKEAREGMALRNGVGQFDDELERIDAALAKIECA